MCLTVGQRLKWQDVERKLGLEGIALKETVDTFINIFVSEKEITSYQEQHTLRENPDVDREYAVQF